MVCVLKNSISARLKSANFTRLLDVIRIFLGFKSLMKNSRNIKFIFTMKTDFYVSENHTVVEIVIINK